METARSTSQISAIDNNSNNNKEMHAEDVSVVAELSANLHTNTNKLTHAPTRAGSAEQYTQTATETDTEGENETETDTRAHTDESAQYPYSEPEFGYRPNSNENTNTITNTQQKQTIEISSTRTYTPQSRWPMPPFPPVIRKPGWCSMYGVCEITTDPNKRIVNCPNNTLAVTVCK